MSASVTFPCPQCGGDARAIDSRPSGDARRRRRECRACKFRFTTREQRIPDGVTKPVLDGPFGGGVSIVSDGTPQGSTVLDASGRVLPGVRRVRWTVDAAKGLAHAEFELEGVPVTVQALEVEAIELRQVVATTPGDGDAETR